jgi:hypothetical protein
MNKSKIIDQIINTAKEKGAEKVAANVKNNAKPDGLGYKGSRVNFVPDVVAYYPNKRDLFSIEEKMTTSKLPEMISKWILFSLEARKRKGKFYLMVPEKNEEKFAQIINEKQISAELRVV